MKKLFFFLGLSLILTSCARVGSPVGGAKDSLAPRFMGSNIDTTRINVPTSLKSLQLNFDEYVTLKDVQRNLTISPPIKIKRILPSMLGNKYVLIEWEEPLLENTTYNLNFGNAITDLNEGNVLSYFNYAFSTGDYLDETYISGEVKDGMLRTREEDELQPTRKSDYVVGLYQEKDSMDYRAKPYYITKADPDGYYELNYLTPGIYRLLAFEDENQNSVFDAGEEKVAFLKDTIDLKESISGLPITLYPSKKPIRYKETKETLGGFTVFFEGEPRSVSVQLDNRIKDYKVTYKPYSDSLHIWFDARKEDIGITQSENIKFSYQADDKTGEASLFYRLNPQNEMTLSNAKGNVVPPNSPFEIISNYPIDTVNSQNWSLKVDSMTTLEFKALVDEINPKKLKIDAHFESGKKYSLTLPKESVSSYYISNEKAYQFNFEVDKEENYGTLVLQLQGAPQSKFWIQFLDQNEVVKFQRLVEGSEHRFTEIPPATYQLRILVDQNGNGVWDAADFANFDFAEPVFVFPKQIEIRGLWENRESWDLTTGSTETPNIPADPLLDPSVEKSTTDSLKVPIDSLEQRVQPL
ncbi:Ig-like domain-containing domain [Chryseobacterium sp. A321]